MLSELLCISAILVVSLAAPSLPNRYPWASSEKKDLVYRATDIAQEYPPVTPIARRPVLPSADTFVANPFRVDAVPTNSRDAVVGSSEPNVDYVETYAPPETQDREAFVIKSQPRVQFMPPADTPASKDSMDLKFLPPADSVVPKFTGSFIQKPDEKRPDFDWSPSGAITNPAAFYLQGASMENVKPSKCRMIGCDGPVPNDSDIFLQNDPNIRSNTACHQTFVPLNSCVDGRGYPVGMICTICCDCTADFKSEMVKSRGYIQGYPKEK